MKKIFLSVAAASMLAFTGCANSGLGMNGISQSDVKQVFQVGKIESSQKILVGKSKLTTLSYTTGGAVAGGVAGGLIGNSTNSAVVGGVIGAGVSALASVFQEVEAYQIEILNLKSGVKNIAFIEKQLPLNSQIEYVVRANGEVTNINVASNF